ncbi:hypothetical protein CAE01nite_17850 [Cellulomonas aerilata]|uniref:PAS domain-containing protein n=1 Tax=Cellulomonas aerilata TaxID=515326 RepID=A0A512DCW9_9CELL|nr:hypothetical protein CAE01nite_17850 [Cellulomonas aerilata]
MNGPGGASTEQQAAQALARDAARTAAARRLLEAGATEDGTLRTLAGLAVQLLGTPAAEISLLTDERVIVAAVDALPGPAGTRTSLEAALCTQAAVTDAGMVVADAARDPRTLHHPAVVRGALGAYLAVPIVSDTEKVVGAFCVYGPAARSWDDGDVRTLRHLASAAAVRLEVGALDRQYGSGSRESLLNAAVEAAALGTFQWDLSTGALRWDASLLEAFGYEEKTFRGTIEAFDARVHPDDLVHVRVALDRAIATCGVYEAEFRVLRPDGTVCWLTARGRALPGVDGRAEQVVGVTTDTTALRAQEERVREVLEGMSVAYFRVDESWRFAYVNAEAERILGRPRADLLGGDLWDLFPAAVGTPFEVSYRHVAATGGTVVFDAYYPAPLDAWYEVRAVPERGGVAAFFTDVTARRRHWRTRCRPSARPRCSAGSPPSSPRSRTRCRPCGPSCRSWSPPWPTSPSPACSTRVRPPGGTACATSPRSTATPSCSRCSTPTWRCGCRR